MKTLFIIILLLKVINSYSQVLSTDTGNPSDGEEFVVGNTFSLSPTASSFERFGDIPLSGSSGSMNYQIPLFNIKTVGGNWPLSLNYFFNGLKLENSPSSTGLGWNLNYGGLVKREIRGLPDESEYGYYGNNQVRNKVYEVLNGGIYNPNFTIEYLRAFNLNFNFYQNGKYDSQPDVYNVNISNLKFSFKVGLDNTPVMLSKHNNQVEILWEDYPTNDTYEIKGFEVKDQNGILYEFTEFETSTPTIDEELVLNPRLSWHISKITYPNGEVISFNYQNDTFISHVFEAVAQSTYYNGQFIAPQYHDGFSQSTVERKLLTEISYPGGTILLNLFDDINYNKLYNSILIKNKLNNTVISYNFYYEGNRNLLYLIEKNNKELYKFEYYNFLDIPDFPSPNSFKPLSQDTWGYYNGKPNSHLVSVANSSNFFDSNNETSFIHSRTGGLKKIISPLRGKVEIEYEQNQIKKPTDLKSNYYENIPLVERNKTLTVDFNFGDSQYKQTHKIIHIDKPTPMMLSHTISNANLNTQVEMKIEKVNPDGTPNHEYNYLEYYGSNHSINADQYYNQRNFLSNLIQDDDNLKNELNSNMPPMYPLLDESYFPGDSPGFVYDVGEESQKFIALPGYYKIIISTNNAGVYGDAHAQIKIFSPAIGWDLSNYTNQNVGGLRVKELKKCPDVDNNICETTSFDYNTNDGFSSGKLYAVPRLAYDQKISVNTASPPYDLWHRGMTSGFRVFTDSDYFLNNPVFYEQIKEYKGLGNGYILRKFRMPAENNTLAIYPNIPNGNDVNIFDIKYEGVFKKFNNVYSEINTKSNHFSQIRGLYDQNQMDLNSNHPLGLQIYRKSDYNSNLLVSEPPAGLSEINEIKSYYNYYLYKELDSWYRINEVISKDYFGNNHLENKTEYSYVSDYPKHLKNKTTIINNDIIKENFLYPFDFDLPIYNDMVSKNQISQPIEVLKLKNDNVISRSKTDYTLVGNWYRPHVIYSAKSNNSLEPQLLYNYNSRGRVIEKEKITNNTLNGNNSTTYLWGYFDKYLIAKILNADYNQVISTGINLSSIQNKLINGTPIQNDLDIIRQSLSKSFVTTYDYKPFIGLISKVDSREDKESYEYDNQNRLKIIRNNNGKIIEYNFYNKKSDNELDLAIINTNLSNLVQGYTYPFTIQVNGGSGNFSFNWYVNNQHILSTSDFSINLLILSSYAPSFILSCDVTDNLSGLTQSTSINLTTQQAYSDLDVSDIITNPSPGANNTYSVGSFTCSVQISGGSGNYKYEWRRIYSGKPLVNYYVSPTPAYLKPIVSPGDCNGFTVEARISDLVTGEVIIKNKSISSVDCNNSNSGGGREFNNKGNH